MALTFSYRSNTLTAYYAPGGEGYAFTRQTNITTLCEIIDYTACAGMIGQKALDLDYNGLNSWVFWGGIGNTPLASDDGFTLVYRSSLTDPTLSGQDFMFTLGGRTSSRWGEFSVQFNSSVGLLASMRDGLGSAGATNATIASLALIYSALDAATSTADWTFKMLNTLTGLDVRVFVNGVSVGSAVFTRSYKTYAAFSNYMWDSIVAGATANANNSQHRLNEILIFNTALSDASITATFTGASRTSFYSTTANTPTTSTDPGIANVLSGVGYDFKGQSLTGTYTVPTSTDPGIANVLSGTSYIISGTTYTGTYHDPTYTDPGVSNVASGVQYIFNDSTLTGELPSGATYTDPGIANVAIGTDYIFNNATLTGTLSVPIALTGTAGTVPINVIREQIRFALALNNTTTGSPVQDLSANMSNRVVDVYKLNPEVIPLLGNAIPAVTIYTDRKNIEATGIVKNQANGKRLATVGFQIAGMVWSPNFKDDPTIDPADQDLEYLMENIERVLRGYDSLGNNVSWQFPNSVEYHSAAFDEDAHLRIGLMDLTAKVYY